MSVYNKSSYKYNVYVMSQKTQLQLLLKMKSTEFSEVKNSCFSSIKYNSKITLFVGVILHH